MKCNKEQLENIIPEDKKKTVKTIVLILAIISGIAIGIIVIKKFIDSKIGDNNEEEDFFDDEEIAAEEDVEGNVCIEETYSEAMDDVVEEDELDDDFAKSEDMDE